MRKTSKIIKRIILKKKESPNQKDEDLRFCNFYKKEKLIKHVRRKAEPRNLKIFDKIYIDVIIIILQDIRKKKYATVFIEKVILIRWAYFYYLKNSAYDALVKFQKMVKTQFDRVIKKWRMDGGKEYSPKKLAELAEDLGQVVELTTPYSPEQDGTSERSIGILCERTRTIIIDLNIPIFL